MLVKVQFGCGYGQHETELDFDDNATDEEIEQDVSDFARERFWWSWDRPE